MGKSWASAAEQEFLKPEIETFASTKEHRKYGNRARFFNGVYLRYFEKFPMPETDESGRSLEERMSERRSVSP
jgi:hypothetical protein